MVEETNMKIKLEIKEEIKEEEHNIDQDYNRICNPLVVSIKDETKPNLINTTYQPFSSDNSGGDYKNYDIKKCKVLIKPLSLNLVKNGDIKTEDHLEDPFLWCIKEEIFKTIKQDPFCESREDKKINIKLEGSSEIEDNLDQYYTRTSDSLVISVKDETKPTFNNASCQPFCSDNTGVDYKIYDIKDREVLIKPLCFNLVKSEDINTKDYKKDPLLCWVKEEICKTIKKDPFCTSSEDKGIDVTLKDTSQRNSCEIDEEDSDANMDEPPSMESLCQESTITKPTAEKKKKKYIRALKHICQYCNKKFPQSDILKYHVMIHTGEKPHECNFCSKRFRTVHGLNLHIQTHTQKKYPCEVCNQRFTTKYILLRHMLTHENKREFKCTLCSSTFNLRDNLYKHIVCVHNNKQEYVETLTKTPTSIMNSEKNSTNATLKEFQCDYCKKLFTSRENVRYHIKHVHILKTTSSCKTSNKNTTNKQSENVETLITKETLIMNADINNTVAEFQCEHCKKTFPSREYLRYHIKKMHILKNSYGCKTSLSQCSFTCAVCKANFKIRKHFNLHIQNIHPTEKPYGCASCDKSFKLNSNLQAHITVRHTNKINSYVCDICSMSFYRESYLKRHYKIHTQSDRKFSCDVCNIKCRSKTDIKRHLATHFGGADKPHQCEFCEKSFSKPSKLARHKAVHTGERAYKCKLCDKTYKDESSLKHHENVHEGNTFTCAYCGFKSINEHSFRRHIRHKICQKKIFTCKVCDKKLTSEKFLKNHMTNIHDKCV